MQFLKELIFKYSGKSLNVTNHVRNKSDFHLVLNISGKIYEEFQVVHSKTSLKIPTESYFNIVLETMSYFGPNEYPESCFYGGIAVYIIEGLKVIEALTACWNISNKHVDILNGSSPTYNIVTTRHTTSVIIVCLWLFNI